jgi:hypothetical protein
MAIKAALKASLPNLDVFVDQTELRYGHLWQPALFDAIAKADAFVILVSNRIGDWQKVEYYEARDRKAKDDSFVLLPIIIADRTKGAAANLPGLAQLHWIETTEPTSPEPLASIISALRLRELPKPPEPWRVINPYRGLVALDEEDADFFFGRDRETRDIINDMTAKPGRLITLVGNSGVGKSSLVQAGVMGALKRQRWPGGEHPWPEALKDSRAWAYLSMKPGDDPIAEFASAFTSLWFPDDATDPRRLDRRNEWTRRLKCAEARISDLIRNTDERFRQELGLSPPPRFFLYIDQGEELYARTPAAESKRFSEMLSDGLSSCARRLIVITSQRADYYGELQANKPIFRITEKVDVEPLDAEALALVLREPAGVLGVKFESDALVDQAVRSAVDQPGALPLLADLFTDLWERMREQGNGVLRVSDSREIIQIGAALSKRADQFLARYPEKAEVVRRLLSLRLAHVPRQGEPVRTRWEYDAGNLEDPSTEVEWATAEELAGPEWRLLVTGEKDGKAIAEVAHEILLKTWEKLKGWLEAEREFLVWRGEITASLEDWKLASKEGPRQQRQALLLGLPLATAETWLQQRARDISFETAAYIGESARYNATRRRASRRLLLMIVVLLIIQPIILNYSSGTSRIIVSNTLENLSSQAKIIATAIADANTENISINNGATGAVDPEHIARQLVRNALVDVRVFTDDGASFQAETAAAQDDGINIITWPKIKLLLLQATYGHEFKIYSESIIYENTLRLPVGDNESRSVRMLLLTKEARLLAAVTTPVVDPNHKSATLLLTSRPGDLDNAILKDFRGRSMISGFLFAVGMSLLFLFWRSF